MLHLFLIGKKEWNGSGVWTAKWEEIFQLKIKAVRFLQRMDANLASLGLCCFVFFARTGTNAFLSTPVCFHDITKKYDFFNLGWEPKQLDDNHYWKNNMLLSTQPLWDQDKLNTAYIQFRIKSYWKEYVVCFSNKLCPYHSGNLF